MTINRQENCASLVKASPSGRLVGLWCMKKQEGDNKIIIGGTFTYYSDTTHPALNVTRILPVSGAPTGEAKNGVIVYESEPEIDIFDKDIFVLYPNPTTGILNFTTDIFKNTAFSIQIYNTLGQLVVNKQNMSQNDTSIDVGNLVKGNYFIVFSNNEKTITKTIIVNKN